MLLFWCLSWWKQFSKRAAWSTIAGIWTKTLMVAADEFSLEGFGFATVVWWNRNGCHVAEAADTTVWEIFWAFTIRSAALAKSWMVAKSCIARIDLTWVGNWAKKKARLNVSALLLRDSSFRRSTEGVQLPKPEILRSSASFWACVFPKAPNNASLIASYFLAAGGWRRTASTSAAVELYREATT